MKRELLLILKTKQAKNTEVLKGALAGSCRALKPRARADLITCQQAALSPDLPAGRKREQMGRRPGPPITVSAPSMAPVRALPAPPRVDS